MKDLMSRGSIVQPSAASCVIPPRDLLSPPCQPACQSWIPLSLKTICAAVMNFTIPFSVGVLSVYAQVKSQTQNSTVSFSVKIKIQ